MPADLSAKRISEWTRWVEVSSRSDQTYKPKALLAVLENDGERMLSAVLKSLKMEKTHQLIEAMREPGTKTSAHEDAE